MYNNYLDISEYLDFRDGVLYIHLNDIDEEKPIGDNNPVYYVTVECTGKKFILKFIVGYSNEPLVTDTATIDELRAKLFNTRVGGIFDAIRNEEINETEENITKRINRGISWIVDKKNWQGAESTGQPDWNKNLPLKFPIFGFTEDGEKWILTEAFWSVPKGFTDPCLYVLKIESLPEFGKDRRERSLRSHICIRFDNNISFDQSILPPSLREKWMISRQTVKEYIDGVNIEPSKIFDELYSDIIPKHLWIENDGARKTLSYWSLGTYFYDVFDAYPLLHFFGFYGSGKTRGGLLMDAISYHGTLVSDLSSADLFRTKEEHKPTMIIDENEQNKRVFATLRDELINSSYVRGGGRVGRRREMKTEHGRQYVRDVFRLYAPTSMCSISPITTAQQRSRVITITMIKKSFNPPEARREHYKDFQRNCYLFRLYNWYRMREIYLELKDKGISKDGESLDARFQEVWLPIFTLMKYLGREKEDFDDIFNFAKNNIDKIIEMDAFDEIRQTLYRAIAKIYVEALKYPEDKDNLNKDKLIKRWHRNPNNIKWIFEWERKDLVLVMQHVSGFTGYINENINAKNISSYLMALGCKSGNHPQSRRVTFKIDMRSFKKICYDHLRIDVEELGSYDYDKMVEILDTTYSKVASQPSEASIFT